MASPPALSVAAVVSDFFMRSSIDGGAKLAGAAVRYLAPETDIGADLVREVPDVLLLDLSLRTPDGLGLLRQLRALPGLAGLRIVGYLNHVEEARKAEATAAGCDLVVTRAFVAKKLAEYLRGLSPGAAAAAAR